MDSRTKATMWSDEWFEDCFTNPVSGERYHLPPGLEKASRRIVRAYGIRGVCDPMYIANVIAVELGLGDGLSNFTTPAEA